MAKSKKAAEVAADEVVKGESSVQFSEELKATLEKYPHIDCVYVDDKGNWHFAAKPGYTAYDREAILNG